MSDSKKTKKELLAEIEALRAKLAAEPPAPGPEATDEPRSGLTRRDVLASAWVAPIILTAPLGASVSQRANALEHTPAPTTYIGTPAPTGRPTRSPTGAPTAFPTATPDVIPVEISEFDVS